MIYRDTFAIGNGYEIQQTFDGDYAHLDGQKLYVMLKETDDKWVAHTLASTTPFTALVELFAEITHELAKRGVHVIKT